MTNYNDMRPDMRTEDVVLRRTGSGDYYVFDRVTGLQIGHVFKHYKRWVIFCGAKVPDTYIKNSDGTPFLRPRFQSSSETLRGAKSIIGQYARGLRG